MTRTEWINSYTTEMSNQFITALYFYSSHTKKRCKNQQRIVKKYWRNLCNNYNIVPTQSEYNFVINNKYFQRFIDRHNNPKHNIGDLVCVKLRTPLTFTYTTQKYKFYVGVVVSVKPEHTGNYYHLKFINHSEDYSDWDFQEHKLKKVEFRNLDKYHRSK